MSKKKIVVIIIVVILLGLAGVGIYHMEAIYSSPEAVIIREMQLTKECHEKMLSDIKADTTHADYVVLVNPSHGGSDTGMTSGGTKEKDINLKVARYMRDLNTNKKIKIYITRETDTNPSAEQRAEIMEALNPDLIVDIHMDSDSTVSVMGMYALYYGAYFDYHLTNEELADMLLRGAVSTTKTAAIGVVDDTTAVEREIEPWIYESRIPSASVYCGYLSNPDELQALRSNAYCQNIAKGLINGIEEAVDKLDKSENK